MAMKNWIFIVLLLAAYSCSKGGGEDDPTPEP